MKCRSFSMIILFVTLIFASSVLAEEWSIIVLPDTQKYAKSYPHIFHTQTEWIVDNVATRNIKFVLHLGDLVDGDLAEQWAVARSAIQTLDDNNVPYALALGNHDYQSNPPGGGKTVNRDTLFNNYFPIEDYQGLPWFGGVYSQEPNRMDNSYFKFNAGGKSWLVLSLRFGPENAVLEWANNIAANNPGYNIILITHAYLYNDGSRYNWASKGSSQKWNPYSYPLANAFEVNDGEGIWKKLVSKHKNFVMTLNGHVLGDGLGKLTSVTPLGNEVHQMLVNFQMKPHGGDGYLRILTFSDDGKKVDVQDYSPYLDKYKTSSHNKFTLELFKPASAPVSTPPVITNVGSQPVAQPQFKIVERIVDREIPDCQNRQLCKEVDEAWAKMLGPKVSGKSTVWDTVTNSWMAFDKTHTKIVKEKVPITSGGVTQPISNVGPIVTTSGTPVNVPSKTVSYTTKGVGSGDTKTWEQAACLIKNYGWHAARSSNPQKIEGVQKILNKIGEKVPGFSMTIDQAKTKVKHVMSTITNFPGVTSKYGLGVNANYMAEALDLVRQELDRFYAANPSVKKYVIWSGNSCRTKSYKSTDASVISGDVEVGDPKPPTCGAMHRACLAFDINPQENPACPRNPPWWGRTPSPWEIERCNGGKVVSNMPKEIVHIFEKFGFFWLGRRSSPGPDSMHFEFIPEYYLVNIRGIDKTEAQKVNCCSRTFGKPLPDYEVTPENLVAQYKHPKRPVG